MGRVRRYKKIKPCDPFYRGNKKKDPTSKRGYNLPPDKGSTSQPMSRSFRDFLLYTQNPPQLRNKKTKREEETKEKPHNKPRKQTSTDKVMKEEEIDDNDEVVEFKRAKGESARHYLLRVEYETNKRLMLAQRRTTQNSEKRKEYLKKRKLKLKLRKKGIKLEDVEAFDFEDLKDHIRFGEVVKEPPQLRQTAKTKEMKMNKSLLLSKKLQNSTTNIGLKKQKDLAEEREKMIDIYRQIKQAKRTSK